MILVIVKWKLKPEHVDDFPTFVSRFTEATRTEPGNVFFDWSRSIEDPSEFTSIEGFRDDTAVQLHITAAYFTTFIAEAAGRLARTPLLISHATDDESWSEMAGLNVN